jgi:hypothetical protein
MISIRFFVFLLAAAGTALAQTVLSVPLSQELLRQQQCAAQGTCEPGQAPAAGTAQGQQQPRPQPQPQGDVDPTTESVRPAPRPPERPPVAAGTEEGAAVQEPNEFQRFVKNSLGRDLPIYGSNLFDRVPSTFAPLDRVQVPAEYVIGPGDELFIRAWGSFDLQSRVVVDRNGQIHLPKVGSVTVAGIKQSEITE